MTRTLVVVGHGMVGRRMVEELRRRDEPDDWRVIVLAEEPRPAYDRANLSSYLDGRTAEDLTLTGPQSQADPMVDLRLATPATRIDPRARTVTAGDTGIAYDALVLATGSRPIVPPVAGNDLDGCHVYRTFDDLDAIRAATIPGRPGVVIGGGLLGLEAANALRLLGMRPQVVEMAPHPMPQQLDGTGGQILAGLIGALDIPVHCATAATEIHADAAGRVCGVSTTSGSRLDADLVVFSAGIRPRDELAGPAGLATAEGGGFLVDRQCRASEPGVWAIGECAAVEGRRYGLVAPGYRMAEAVAGQLTGHGDAAFVGSDPSTELKLLGIDVASFGDVHARTAGALELAYTDHAAGTYAKFVLDADARTLLGGALVGNTSAYPLLAALVGHELPARPEYLLDRVPVSEPG
ncbi:NAD(P)/FAD-dependent oxidoreductase [Kibdelosporangium aridum]|uniref:Nitrite reductase (NADH) large subunit n=1 Tax=Kibdelosporangium aridum TaxID=2030 RepID=A0A1W2FW66_KIBAR|nr:FAD-dependent oxidoreductase [Kibdelosporangium aridum]SMD25876.1 nitrite reductase (NADH) large subunit [Kibdelosporangium aridum]